ncbi:MAG: hypothetical protein O2867_01255 [Bacteroidetes bacterium]|nr:hypothetical protein [Bacteroidota bacterium]
MINRNSIKQAYGHIVYFFPVQLLILHFKRNHLLLIFWFLLFGYTSGILASKYGVRYLFLYPEYLGHVGFASYFILGFSLGGFIIAFNIYSYVIHAHRFPFIATLSRPFYKFCINNFLLPAVFVAYYLITAFYFKKEVELETTLVVLGHLSGFLIGLLIFLILSLLYFYGTNKDVLGFISPKEDRSRGRFASIYDRFMSERRKQQERTWYKKPWRVETYLIGPLSLQYARDTEHYDEETLAKVFSQNHMNASLFELLLVVSFLIVSNYTGFGLLAIPGGASVILFFTLLLMVLSIFLSWFRGWALSIIITIALIMNSFSGHEGLTDGSNRLYGLDYSEPWATYDPDASAKIHGSEEEARDRLAMTALMDKWKKDNLRYYKAGEKPKLVIVQCSGGGLRSALWTTTILSELDSVLNGSLMDRTFMITGASGGILGAAALREHYIQNNYESIYKSREQLKESISKDLLNPLLSSIASSDIFFNFRTFEYRGLRYPVDRAYRFEEQFLKNTSLDLGKPLSSYKNDELNTRIPFILIAPTIINDGRRLLVSNLPLGFMRWDEGLNKRMVDHQQEYVEFGKLFANRNPGATRFLSIIRANATFPYILPQASLPTEPEIQLMDAGIRDNFGFDLTYLFVSSMKEWIQQETSGIVFIKVRDKRKDIMEEASGNSLLQRLSSPLGNVYGNFTKTHDFVDDALFSQLIRAVDTPIRSFTFQMEQPGSINVSMSYHLTALEKTIIRSSARSEENQRILLDIKRTLDQ